MKTVEKGEEFLAHFGVKGMKWGVRRRRDHTSERGAEAVTTIVKKDARLSRNAPHKKQTRIIAKGGRRADADPDAIRIEMHKRKLRKSGVDAMSTKELRELTDRLRLEQQAVELAKGRGQKKVKSSLASGAKSAFKQKKQGGKNK